MTQQISTLDRSTVVEDAKFRCLACGRKTSFFGKKSGYTYCICTDCKTVQLSPTPSQFEVERAYQSSQYATAAHGQGNPDTIRDESRRYYVSLADTLAKHGATGTVIDYGAGWGGLCELLVKRGFDARGLELAQNMVEECQRRGLPVEQKTLETLAKDGSKAGAIVLSGVFEHLLDPDAYLQNAHAILDDGGLLVSMQPVSVFSRLLAAACRRMNPETPLPSAFWIFDPPWHVAFYSLKGMKLIAGRNGFEIIAIHFAPQGRVKGLYGVAQRLLEYTNRIGWAFFRHNWPLMVSHTYVLRKISSHREPVSPMMVKSASSAI